MSSFLALLDAAAARPAGGLDLRYAGTALGLVILSIGLIRWSIRTYLETSGITPVKGLRSPTMSPQFRVLQEMGLATGEQLSTMGATEREMLFMQAMTRRSAAGAPGAAAGPAAGPAAVGVSAVPRVAPGSAGAAQAAMGGSALTAAVETGPAPAFRVSCAPDYLFCPACGATIGDRRTPIGYITSCLACKRVLKARLQGERVTIEAAGS